MHKFPLKAETKALKTADWVYCSMGDDFPATGSGSHTRKCSILGLGLFGKIHFSPDSGELVPGGSKLFVASY
jgi:hypothetical protein